MRNYEREYQTERDKIVQVCAKLRKTTDAEIIEFLRGKNTQGVIKQALRMLMELEEQNADEYILDFSGGNIEIRNSKGYICTLYSDDYEGFDLEENLHKLYDEMAEKIERNLTTNEKKKLKAELSEWLEKLQNEE